MRSLVRSGLILVLSILAWDSLQPHPSPAAPAAAPAPPEATMGTRFVDCPVTTPVLADPPDPEQPDGMDRSPLGLGWWHFSDDGLLGTAAIPYQTIGGQKVLWVKPVGSTLTVTGHPLGAESPTLGARIPSGYPGDFQASGVFFPTAGCWEVTARAGQSELRFITYVIDPEVNQQPGEPWTT